MRFALLALALAACGGSTSPGSRPDASPDQPDAADIDPDAGPLCPALGDGWVVLGGGPLHHEPRPGFFLGGAGLVTTPRITASYSVVDPDEVWTAWTAELADDGTWRVLGAPAEGGEGRIGLDVARDDDGVWLLSMEFVPDSEDIDIRLSRWDGSTWHEAPTPLNVRSYGWRLWNEAQTMVLASRPQGGVLTAFGEYTETTTTTDGPFDVRVASETSAGGAVDRALVDLPGVVMAIVTGVHAGAARDLVVVTPGDFAQETWVLSRTGTGAFTPVGAGPLAGPAIGSLVTGDGRIVLVEADGSSWVSDGTMPWQSFDPLPLVGRLHALRTHSGPAGTFAVWSERPDPDAGDKIIRLARLDGDHWTSVMLGRPAEATGEHFFSSLAVDACGRPVVSGVVGDETSGRTLYVWRYDGEGVAVD
jgi:hypothetical protein